MRIDRRQDLKQQEFLEEFLAASRPVIVNDAIRRWGSADVWTPEYFLATFGGASVQVYDDLFNLKTVSTLRKYLEQYWRTAAPHRSPTPYVRWYAKLKDVDFAWADSAFEALAKHWRAPYFLPESGYLLPARGLCRTADPVHDAFPGRGLFISAAGARTRLHQDPWNSDAVLCQVYGDKRVVLYRPEKAPLLTSDGQVVDIDQPDLTKFPHFDREAADFDDVLAESEVLFIPAGWYHHATSVTNSISITWNFVHVTRWPSFFQYLLRTIPSGDREVLAYFADLATRA